MKIVPFNQNSLMSAVAILRRGGVIAHPADTCFGLAGDLRNPKALEKIQAIKGRGPTKPMSIMVAVPEQLNIDRYAILDDFSCFVANKLFPSPVTLVLPKGPAIPDFYFPETDKIGLRIPLHSLTQDILSAFKRPLITTSANPSGQPICFDHQTLVKLFKDQTVQPDLVIEGKSIEHTLASTVIQIEKNHVRIVRQGPLTATHLSAILGVEVLE